MQRFLSWSLVSFLVFSFSLVSQAQSVPAGVPDPESVFGFEPGTDRKLIDYSQLIDYVGTVAEVSPRVAVEEIGRTTLDRPMKLVFISSEGNLQRLDELRSINRRLALDPAIPDDERQALIETSPVFVMATLSMHSTEVAPAQTLPILTHLLATTEDPELLGWLDDVVIMVVACLNPDGMDMIVNHYRENLDTPYEGGSMPGLYHHYVGHDNNRDFVALTQAESQVVSRVFSTEWYPQVLMDKHQMGRTGPRYFVPRYHDPIAENIDGGLWTWSDVFGSGMARELGASGHTGVASNWTFDEYWPGATTTSHWKGVISILTEAASARVATPVFVEANELRVRGKGLSEYKKSVNMPSPWPGGWWRLGDIVDYELASWRGALTTASTLRKEILTFRNDLCRAEIERGLTEPPFYYVIPSSQHDASERDHMVKLLGEHGVEIERLSEDVKVGGSTFQAGDLVVPLAQPYRPFIKEVMEHQRYPVRHYTPDGDIIRPYDITSWSLPLHLGVTAIEVNTRSESLENALESYEADAPVDPSIDSVWGVALDPRDNASYRVVFEALNAGVKVARATEGLSVGEAVLPAGAFVIEKPRGDVLDGLTRTRFYPLEARPESGLNEISKPRIALIETWYHDMDAGWTRYLLEDYGVSYTLLRPGDVAKADLAKSFDVVILPDADQNVLTKGKYKSSGPYRINDYPPQYRKGFGEDGAEQLDAFIEGGGLIVAWGRSTGLFFETLTFGEGDEAMEIELPVRDDAEGLSDKGFYAPGSVLAVHLNTDHPVNWGMPDEFGVFTRGRPVLGTGLPMLIADRSVLGVFPDEDILLSGYAEKVELLANRPAMVWVRAGQGQFVLFGFQPQFRASTPGTFKLLFNSLLLPKVSVATAGVAGVAR
jgi:Zinc carboxypeptidase